MIAVQKVIRKLVSDYEFVIIPGFGALLSHQIPAIFDKDSGTFSPPVKKLAFNEFLKLDDGLLANYISREENVSHVEAVAHVKRYADLLHGELQSGGATKIDGIGEFRTNSEGKLVFEPNTSNYFKDEWYGFSKITVQALEKSIFLKNEPQHIVVNEDEVEVVELKSGRKVKSNWLRYSAAAVLAGLVLYISIFLVNTSIENNKSTLNPFAQFFSTKTVATELVVREPLAPVYVLSRDSAVQEVRLDSVKINETKPDSVNSVVPVVSDKQFYLIAGAFKGKRQAGVLLKTLQSKGFDDAFLIPASARSSKVKVAVQGFDEEKDAYRAAAKLKEVIGEEGWVFKKK